MNDWFPAEVRDQLREDLAASYALSRRIRAYTPTRMACSECGGVNADGEPYDITCQYCENGYVVTWVVQEIEGRVADVAHVTQVFVTVTPGIEVGDKLLTVAEGDAATLQAVYANQQAYLEVDGIDWRPQSVQPSHFGEHQEWMAHLRKYTSEIRYGEGW